MIYDALVVGLGAMGSAGLYQLSKRSRNVCGIDRFSPPHPFGSTHGDTRITRQAIGEGEHFVPLALRSYEIWDELERLSGNRLLTITGGLFVGNEQSALLTRNKPGWLKTTIAASERYGIAHRILDKAALRREYPQFHYAETDIGYLEEKAGFLRPELCITTQLAQARANGADVRTNETMLSFEEVGDEVRVRTDRGEYRTRQLILTTGSWVLESLRDTPWRDLLQVYRQVLYWFDVESAWESYRPERFPVFILSDRSLYGFPAVDGPAGGIKIAKENYTDPTTPDAVDRTVSEAETRRMYEEVIRPDFHGIGSGCVKAVVCLYTMTPNGDFLIDRHPDCRRVLVTSCCSGHGFKHSAAVGQILSDLALDGRTDFDLSRFRFDQFAKL
ncbi:N-methyl-L-tryptophan oxidase [Larkinella soli]|uniref:N-methyl-L-tryptophan oxidase n=1 Tax=Larkinella soli TaxID=1770527 RepID=UPI000FFBA11D|nr:N-methyl-L-tryptophan oxidase [Larkinella soli]